LIISIHQSRRTQTVKEVGRLTNPIPTPRTILATMICASPYELACRIAPRIMITTPIKIDFFRPRNSPMKLVASAPRKHPISY
jgi:hypothetical protein